MTTTADPGVPSHKDPVESPHQLEDRRALQAGTLTSLDPRQTFEQTGCHVPRDIVLLNFAQTKVSDVFPQAHWATGKYAWQSMGSRKNGTIPPDPSCPGSTPGCISFEAMPSQLKFTYFGVSRILEFGNTPVG